MYNVSIPYGTIKSVSRCNVGTNRNVSIPYGTIKSQTRVGE